MVLTYDALRFRNRAVEEQSVIDEKRGKLFFECNNTAIDSTSDHEYPYAGPDRLIAS